MSDIKPMLLEEIDFVPPLTKEVFDRYKGWIFQEKQNGFRAIAHIKHGKIVAISNRRNIPCLNLYPELSALQFGDFDAIIDGEVVQFDNKHKSIFYGGLNQRDKKFYPERVAVFPISFVAFDILYAKGEVVVSKPYSERYALLKGLFGEGNPHFKVVENIANPEEYWEKVIVPENREGLVVKNPNSKYEVDTRSKNNLKLKNYKVADTLVEKVEPNYSKRDGRAVGLKIFGKAKVGDTDVEVECQFGGNGIDIKAGEVVPVVYLDIVGNKMIQPHKIKGFGLVE